jgi:transposase-like protein
VGTIFHDTHLPLIKWFAATFLLCEAKKGISACQIQRTLGMSYKTAWYLCHRIRAAMIEIGKPKLNGIVEMDETYVGGKAKGGKANGKTGRGTDKEIVIGIRKRNGDLRMFHASDVKAGTIAQFIRENVSEDVDVIMTDDFASYPFAMERAGIPRTRHKTIKHSSRVYVIGDIHTNTVESAFSLLKRGIMGTWHRVSAKHLPAYLDEMCFRFNNRKNPYLFRDTILRLIASPNLEYKKLTSKEDAA